MDLRSVDVTFSEDKKSFDARAILRSTYHLSFLERGLSSLPAEEAEEPAGEEEEEPAALGAGRARRSAAATATPATPTEISLKTHNLTIGSGAEQIYPSRLVSISLDGASVNLGHKAGVVALCRNEVPHVVGVHAVAHVTELAWADALKGEALIDEMLETNQMGYNHYAGSGKKKLSYSAACSALGEDEHELVSLHGIRWRESTHRGAKNLLLSWKARVTDLKEEAAVEIGLTLTPLSPPESFINLTFMKKTHGGSSNLILVRLGRHIPTRLGRYTPARLGRHISSPLVFTSLSGEYGNGELTFILKVVKCLGKRDGVNMFQAKYMRVLRGRTCRNETEEFSQGDIIDYLLDQTDQRERLNSTAAGKLLERLTRFSYVATLAFWVDATFEGKALSKLFQKNGVLLSDVTSGVEDSISSISALKVTPGPFMKGFAKDFDDANESFYGFLLSDVNGGKEEYKVMLSNITSSIVDHLNERFCGILDNPTLKAACIFEHARWPSFQTSRQQLEQHGDTAINVLLEHFKVLYEYLGGDPTKVLREWRRLKLYVSNPENNLYSLSYQELYERLFDQRSDKKQEQHYYNVLLLVALVMCIAVDTSICERGFSLMNSARYFRIHARPRVDHSGSSLYLCALQI